MCILNFYQVKVDRLGQHALSFNFSYKSIIMYSFLRNQCIYENKPTAVIKQTGQ